MSSLSRPSLLQASWKIVGSRSTSPPKPPCQASVDVGCSSFDTPPHNFDTIVPNTMSYPIAYLLSAQADGIFPLFPFLRFVCFPCPSQCLAFVSPCTCVLFGLRLPFVKSSSQDLCGDATLIRWTSLCLSLRREQRKCLSLVIFEAFVPRGTHPEE
mmetsp:Transcript_10604/g.23402  ORF Transcript_10604/g.23402 Transcript_10604/m.23402 type:complete len:156 (+) Transcript_10604:90-557(+)